MLLGGGEEGRDWDLDEGTGLAGLARRTLFAGLRAARRASFFFSLLYSFFRIYGSDERRAPEKRRAWHVFVPIGYSSSPDPWNASSHCYRLLLSDRFKDTLSTRLRVLFRRSFPHFIL